MKPIRYTEVGEEDFFCSFVLHEEKTLCGRDVPYDKRSWVIPPYGRRGLCPVCKEAEKSLRALIALTGEEEADIYERLSRVLFRSPGKMGVLSEISA